MPTYQSILFDLDGTLLDTAFDLTMAFKQLLKDYGLPTEAFSTAEIRYAVGFGSQKLYDMAIAKQLKIDDFNAFKDHFQRNYRLQKHQQTRIFPGFEEVINHINEKKIPWGIVTNKLEASAKEVVSHFPLLETAQVIVGADTASDPKPSAAPILYACEMLDVDPAASLFVGDTVTDVVAANAANMPVVLAQYGYDTAAHLDYPNIIATIAKAGELMEHL